MKTLLTEKQVKKIHAGDNHSARCTMKIGKTFTKGRFWKKKTYRCVDKLVFKIDTCPHCGKHNTFHKRSQDIVTLDISRNYGNVYKVYQEKDDNQILFHKIDYCLDCHKEFSIEMFMYVREK